ncbi:MAG: tail fiber domain-containing protein [Bacteroidetes bacterium]|nr:MAG: tail fiber domain-containing protein [Bacteroidota bacterium]
MKNLLCWGLFIALFFGLLNTHAQSMKGFHYQAVARDNAGNLLAGTSVNLSFRIREGNPAGAIVYQEVHALNTNALGQIEATIGKGTAEVGDFSQINWSQQDYFLEVQLNGASVDTSPLEAVPYSKVATEMKMRDLKDVDLASPAPNQVLKWNGTHWVAAEEVAYTAGAGIQISGKTISNTAPDQVVGLTGSGATTVSGTYPNFTIHSTDNVNDADASTTNEIQNLSLSGNTLSLSLGGGSVNLAPFASPWNSSGSNIYFNTGKVGIGDNSPEATLTVGNGDKLKIDGSDGDIEFSDDQGSIRFASSNGANAPMIQMFKSGTNNSTRMLVAHSPNFSNWGIQYNDTADAFNWIGDNQPVFQVQLSGQRRIGIGTFFPEAKMHILANTSTGVGHLKLTETQFDYARITMNNDIHNNFWDIAARTDTNLNNAQFNIYHSDAGDIFSIRATGRVGINDASPSYPLEVNGNGEGRTINVKNTLPATNTSTFNYGVIANLSQSPHTGFPRLFNIYGFSNDVDAYLSYGVYGFADKASNFNYGVYGVSPVSIGYAGYFSGNVYSTGSYLPSDAALKSHIEPLTNGLQTVLSLKPRRYEYDTHKYEFMHLPEGEQYGFVAQEMEQLLPALTRHTFQAYDKPLSDTPEGQGISFKAINYTALIPFLVSAIQEQQQQIDAQQAVIRSLEERLSRLESKINE